MARRCHHGQEVHRLRHRLEQTVQTNPCPLPAVRAPSQSSGSRRSSLLELLFVRTISLQDELPQTVLSSRIANGAQQEEAAALTIGGELARGERDVLASAVLSRPDAEADQPQAIELAAGKVEFGVR